jgi:type III pantothenate kinase
MILLLDIGNHTLHLGLARSHQPPATSHQPPATGRIIWHQDLPAQSTALRFDRIPAFSPEEEITGAIIASVVPAFTSNFCDLFEKQFGVEPLVLSHRTRTGLRLHYAPKSSLGADRIANAAAAYYLYHKDAIVVDLGTATTLEVVTREGDFLGGAIMPGLGTMLNSLKFETAQLPKLEPSRLGNISHRRLLATSTQSGIQSGIFAAHFAGIDRLTQGITKEIHRKFHIIATGGLSRRFGRFIRNVSIINPLLTLQGLSIIFDLNNTTRRNNG